MVARKKASVVRGNSKVSVKKTVVSVRPKKSPAKRTTKKVTAKSQTAPKISTAPIKRAIKPNAKKVSSTSTPSKRLSLMDKASVATGTSLMVLSPFRFPLDVDKLAIQTARFGGVFFVILGGIFTLWYANLVFSTPFGASLTAMTATSTNDPTNQNTTMPTVDPVTEILVQDSSQAFSVSGGDPLSGDATVRVELSAQPLSARFRAYGQETNSVHELGQYVDKGNQRFEYLLDTTSLPDGKYRFQALVKYQTLTGDMYLVEVTDTVIHTVENDTIDTNTVPPVDDGTTADMATTTSDSSTTAVNDESVSGLSGSIRPFSSTVLSGKQSIRVNATGADKVKLNLYPEGVSVPISLGYATRVNTDEWRLAFETTKHPNGKYRLVALLINAANAKYETTPLRFDIRNDTTATATTITTTTATTVTQTEAEIVASTNPNIDINAIGVQPFSGKRQVNVVVDGATYVELYALPKNAGTLRYLGLPKKVDTGLWTFTWDTVNVPNGEYRLVAKVKTSYGIFNKDGDWVKIFNEVMVTNTEADLKYVAELQSIAEETNVTTEPAKVTSPESTAEANTSTTNETTTAGTEPTALTDTEKELADTFKALADSFREELDRALQRYALALRSGISGDIVIAKENVDRVAAKIKQSALGTEVKTELIAYVDKRIAEAIKRVELDVEKTNIMIAERTKAEATKDSDNDGITDYDEVSIFGTDPYVADSDNDGFTDGAEVLGGYDPTDSRPQVAVAYESPKEVGVVRDDILAVEAITTEDFGGDLNQEENPVALITGRALPNSFVTLYIFSTPVIVTVKTDEDGSWSYRFDRELEDGEHQVYVGITDNAGRVVAKSNPLTFIKEAQAYTPVSAPIPATVVDSGNDESFFSGTVLFMVASISVVALGLVLILLGIHMDGRRRNQPVTETSDAPQAA